MEAYTASYLLDVILSISKYTSVLQPAKFRKIGQH